MYKEVLKDAISIPTRIIAMLCPQTFESLIKKRLDISICNLEGTLSILEECEEFAQRYGYDMTQEAFWKAGDDVRFAIDELVHIRNNYFSDNKS